MKNEGAAKKVLYLKGLAYLHKCMRDHSARYGFIMNEIELVCVRAGCDETGQPYFGFLETSEAIATKTAARKMGSSDHMETDTPMTVCLGLYFLLMLAKSTPLPGQPGGFMDVGGAGALGRQRSWDGRDINEEDRGAGGRDKDLPMPQQYEKREAKTVRGWVWNGDPFHKREVQGGAKRGRAV